MNIASQFREFGVLNSINPMPLDAQVMYYNLMQAFNSHYWPEKLVVSTQTLENNCRMTRKRLTVARNNLIQRGLIKYYQAKQASGSPTYELISLGEKQTGPPSTIYSPVFPTGTEKETQNGTQNGTQKGSPVEHLLKQNELLVVVEKGKRFFKDLKILFEADEGLRRRWLDNGYKHDDFTNGLEYFFQRNHGKPYEDFKKLRDHIFNWIPKYAFELKDKLKNETNRAVNGQRAGKTKGGSITELQSLKQSTDPPSEQRAGFGGAGDDPGREGWQEAEVLN